MGKKRLAVIVMIIVAIIWGGGYSASQIAINSGWSTFSILFARSIIGGAVCLVLAWKTKFWKNKNMLKIGIISGTLFFAGYVLQLEGQKITTISNTAFLTSAGIILVPLFSWIFFRKKPSSIAFIACLIAFIGAAVLSLDDSFKPQIGDLLVLAGAAAYAVHILYIDRHTKDFSAFAIAAIQFIIMGVYSGIGVLVTKSPVFGGPVGWWGIAYFALLSGVVGFVGQIWSQRHLEPSKASLIMSQEGLFATIIAISFMGEPFHWKNAIGGIIMIIAIVFAQIDFNEIRKRKIERENATNSAGNIAKAENIDIIKDTKEEGVDDEQDRAIDKK